MLPGARKGTVPVLRCYGVTAQGHSVCAHIHGFTPYFWTAPPPDFSEKDIPAWRSNLESQLAGAKAKSRVDQAVLAVELVPGKQSLLGYHFHRTQPMLKIYVAMPSIVSAAKGILERGMMNRQYLCFEASVPFVLRYMIDRSITGCNWCEAPAGSYNLREAKHKRVSTAQIELDIVYDSLVSHAPDGEWQRIAPLRILSFDIECMGRKGHFPEAELDPVIQIANVVTLQGATTSIVRNVFTFGSCSSIVGAEVHSFETEEEVGSDCVTTVSVEL